MVVSSVGAGDSVGSGVGSSRLDRTAMGDELQDSPEAHGRPGLTAGGSRRIGAWLSASTSATTTSITTSDTSTRLLSMLTAVLESSIDGIVALRAIRDDEGTIVDFEIAALSAAAERLLNKAASDVVGTTVSQSWPGIPAERFAHYVEVVETGTTWTSRIQMPHSDELWFDIERDRHGGGGSRDHLPRCHRADVHGRAGGRVPATSAGARTSSPARPAHRARQPLAGREPARARAAPARPDHGIGGGLLHRPRRLQVDQRHVRPRRRRQRAHRDRDPPALGGAVLRHRRPDRWGRVRDRV